MTSTIIRAIAHALPENKLTNADLIKRYGEKKMRSISKMSGIVERRVAGEGQCASDLAEVAARRLMHHVGLGPDDIDLIIFTSQTHDFKSPATASVLHGRLGISENCCAFDINQACAGYIHSLQVAHSLIVSGAHQRALILNADTLTHNVNPLDHTMVALTGDAAVATLLEASSETGTGVGRVRICNDGAQFRRLIIPAAGARLPANDDTRTAVADESGASRSLEDMLMDGPSIFHFAVYKIPGFIKETLERWDVVLGEIDTVLLHQANKTMVELIYKSLGVGDHQKVFNLENLGNLAGASLPCLLSEAWRNGIVRPGTRSILCGFGGGLSWGMALVSWPEGLNPAVPGEVDTDYVWRGFEEGADNS